MLYDILKQVNWVDIFFVIILFRTSYVSVNTGLPIEVFKILGTIVAIYLSLHYYSSLASIIHKFIGLDTISVGVSNFISFAALAIFGYMVFLILRNFFSRLVNMEAVTGLNKWIGLALGIARGFLLSSLLIFMFVISGSDYFKASIKDSYSGKFVFKIAPTAYSLIWNSAASKFITWEKANSNVAEAKKDLYQ
jgi:uncharacterized membrane protein required for colicin V production